MSEVIKLKESLERYKLSERDLEEIKDSHYFINSYIPTRFESINESNKNMYPERYNAGVEKREKARASQGRHYWVSSLRLSSGTSLQRNQRPAEVVVLLDKDEVFSLYLLKRSGEVSTKKVPLRDNAGNDLHICETKLQAQYKYNQDIVEAMECIDSQIREKEEARDNLANLKQTLDF